MPGAVPIYLDHHATTPTDPRVIEAMLPWFGHRFGNPHSVDAFKTVTTPAALKQTASQFMSLLPPSLFGHVSTRQTDPMKQIGWTALGRGVLIASWNDRDKYAKAIGFAGDQGAKLLTTGFKKAGVSPGHAAETVHDFVAAQNTDVETRSVRSLQTAPEDTDTESRAAVTGYRSPR